MACRQKFVKLFTVDFAASAAKRSLVVYNGSVKSRRSPCLAAWPLYNYKQFFEFHHVVHCPRFFTFCYRFHRSGGGGGGSGGDDRPPSGYIKTTFSSLPGLQTLNNLRNGCLYQACLSVMHTELGVNLYKS